MAQTMNEPVVEIDIYFVDGRSQTTTVSGTTHFFDGFFGKCIGGSAQRYVSKTLAPIPRNKYSKLIAYLIESDGTRKLVDYYQAK